MAHYKIAGNDVMKPTEAASQPAKATRYP